ncbi:protein TBATA isoform 2-T2 [Menidia menidia]
MSRRDQDSRATTGERSHSKTNQVPFSAEFCRMLTKSSPRFGALSHHSFFSRHNPHPHRVKHIQGLNGRPICTVRDDWFVTSSLFPHPLLKSHPTRKASEPAFTLQFAEGLHGRSKNKSEAWMDELKELAEKVIQSSKTQKEKKENRREDELVTRKTQYSAETGRIIPSSSMSYGRRSQNQHVKYHPFHDQELTVLELLCQILQTDSLSAVQQWLLLAGQREKDLVMGLIRQGLDGVDLTLRNRQSLQRLQAFGLASSPPAFGHYANQPWRRAWRTSSHQANATLGIETPVNIGGAEVLEVHKGAEDHEDSPLKH